MLTTRFTQLVGCPAPIQLAGMGGVSDVSLASAVAEAGGLGMLAIPMAPAPFVARLLDDLRQHTAGAIGINFLVPFLDREAVEVAAPRARVVEFFYGDPDPSLVEAVHAVGALACWQVGSALEARQAVDAGCDLLVAQGIEAGGHVRGRLGLLPLLAEVLDEVDVPVVAAGGIATAQAAAAALAAGASAIRVGTRFVAAAEANAHPRYIEALLAARGEDAVLTDAFSVMWPDAPHRVLASAVDRARAFEGEVVGEASLGDQTMPIPKLAPPTPTRTTTGEVDAMALYAGQAVGAVRRVQPAAEIVQELTEGAERLLTQAVGLVTSPYR